MVDELERSGIGEAIEPNVAKQVSELRAACRQHNQELLR